jgi:hypothetical protein
MTPPALVDDRPSATIEEYAGKMRMLRTDGPQHAILGPTQVPYLVIAILTRQCDSYKGLIECRQENNIIK